MPIIHVDSEKFTPAKKNLHEYIRGVRDKYQVCHRQDAIFGSILPRSTTEVHVGSVTVPKNSQHIFISFLSCSLLVEVFFGIQGEPFSYLAKSPRVSTTTRTRCRRWWPRRCWRRRGRSRRRRTCSTTSGQRLDRSIEYFCRKSGV